MKHLILECDHCHKEHVIRRWNPACYDPESQDWRVMERPDRIRLFCPVCFPEISHRLDRMKQVLRRRKESEERVALAIEELKRRARLGLSWYAR